MIRCVAGTVNRTRRARATIRSEAQVRRHTSLSPRAALVAASALISLAACGGDGPSSDPDAGGAPDAFVPGEDARVPDDTGVPGDAGDPDAAVPPSPLEMSLAEVRGEVAEVTLARDAITAGMRGDAAHLRNDLLLTRLDAIIGEKGLVASAAIIGEKGIMTTSLPVSAVPAIVIVRHLERAIGEIDELDVAWGGTTDPMLGALHAALLDLRAALFTMHALLRPRFREIIDTIAVPTEHENTEYADQRLVHFVPGYADYHVVVEGRDAADPSATITWSCVGIDLVTITVDDDESGERRLELSDVAPGGSHAVTLPADEQRSLRVRLDNLGDPFGYTECDVSFFGPRHLRGDTIPISSGEQSALASAAGTWSATLSRMSGVMAMVRSEGLGDEPALATVIEEYVRERDGASGAWRATITPAVYESDDLEMLSAELTVLDAVGAALEGSRAIAASSRFSAFVPELAALRTADADAAAMLAPGDSRPGTM